MIPHPTGTTGIAAAMAALALSVDDVHALVLRERARAGPNPRVQSELRDQAGLAFDEIARSVCFW